MKHALATLGCALLLGPFLGVCAQKKDVKTNELDKSSKAEARKILLAKELWGLSFPVVLTSLPSWKKIEQRHIALFPDRVVGLRPYPNLKVAEHAASRFKAAAEMRPAFKEGFRKLAAVVQKAYTRPGIKLIRHFADDDSLRVGFDDAKFPIFSQKLTISQVHAIVKRKVTPERKVQPARGERRPEVLTLHSYADGAIIFAESDFSPYRGEINRVILDVNRLTSLLFKDTK